MEKKPVKKSLSLRRTKKEQSQKKLSFGQKSEEAASSSTQPTTEANPSEGIQEEITSTSNISPSVWLSGLCNLGNTCYANSIVQVLRFCPHLGSKVASLSTLLLQQLQQAPAVGEGQEAGPGEGEGCGEDWQMSKGALAIHLHKLWQRMIDKERISSNKSSVLSSTRPQKFLARLREEHQEFDNKLQQDAQEMLRFLLTSLHETVQLVLDALPPPPPVTLPRENSPENPIIIDEDAPTTTNKSLSRKRKHTQNGRNGQKFAKTNGRGSDSKLTDFFPSLAVSNGSGCPTSDPVPSSVQQVVRGSEGEGKEKHLDGSTHSMRGEKVDFVKDMFEGELVSETRCYECDNSTRRTEPFFDVSLAVSSHNLPGFPDCPTPIKDGNAGNSTRVGLGKDYSGSTVVGPFSLSWAISQFCFREKLGGENKYSCERCGHLVEAERSLLFGHLPQVMTFHLNRFEMQCMYGGLYSGLSVNKIGGNISIPLTLCLSAWCTEDCARRKAVYQLFAAVFHTGSSCTSGHYTACVRGRECRAIGSQAAAEWIRDDRNWVEFDDEVVEVLTQQELMDRLSPLTPSTAYILFYCTQ